MNKNKRGAFGATQAVSALLAIFIILVIIFSVVNYNSNGGNFSSALEESLSDSGNFFMSVFGPLFNILLGLDREGIDSGNQLLLVLTFILISIIIISVLDSINLFGEGETTQSKLINFFIGLIVAAIGVRFMPQDIWQSLTAPASAFVATILVGAPFAALFFITMKLKSPLVSKALWLFYIVFMSYLIFTMSSGKFIATYIVFLVLAGVMLFFDSSVRRFFRKEKEKNQVQKMLGDLDIKQRHKMRENINEWTAILADSNSSQTDKTIAKVNIRRLKDQYGDNLEDI